MSHLKEKPNRHLEHTIIPEPPRMNSLEDFLDRFRPPLSFFAKRISQSDRHSLLRNAEKRGSLIPPNHSKQATLYTAQMHRISGLTRSVSECYLVYRIGSPRKLGRGLHAVASRPKTLTPSNSPNLGKRSHHQKLHRYALRRYFTPASESVESD